MYYQWGHRPTEKPVISPGPVLPQFGTGVGPKLMPGGMPGTGMENPSAYELPKEWVDEQKRQLEELRQKYLMLGQAVGDFGKAIGQAVATGDWDSAFRQIMSNLSSLLVQYAITAAAAAAVVQNWPMVALWLGIAGVAGFSGGFIGAGGGGGGGSGSSALPHYASGTDYVPRTGLAMVHQGETITPAGGARGGGNITVNVYGGMWQSDQLARQVAGAIGKW